MGANQEISMQIDPDRLQVLAHQYTVYAEFCREQAAWSAGPYKDLWLRLAEQWTRLAREANGRSLLACASARGDPRRRPSAFQNGGDRRRQ
jgi:hypothetical protein